MTVVFDPRSREGALAVPVSLGTIVVTGKDRQTWLNGLVTCDLAKLSPGMAAYGLAVSKVGRILADVIVLAAEDRLLVGVPPARATLLRESFDTYLVMEDADLSDGSSEHAWTLLHGPASADLARAVAPRVGGSSGVVDLVGVGGAALVTTVARRDEALSALAGAGATVGDDASWEILRIERAIPAWGIDFDEKTYPQEASLEKRAVSFQKGCYLGQEVVCRLEMRGHVHRKLVALIVDAGAAPHAGDDVLSADGTVMGHVTSATESPHAKAPLALAMVKHAVSEPGTTLTIGGRTARVVDVPVS